MAFSHCLSASFVSQEASPDEENDKEDNEEAKDQWEGKVKLKPVTSSVALSLLCFCVSAPELLSFFIIFKSFSRFFKRADFFFAFTLNVALSYFLKKSISSWVAF